MESWSSEPKSMKADELGPINDASVPDSKEHLGDAMNSPRVPEIPPTEEAEWSELVDDDDDWQPRGPPKQTVSGTKSKPKPKPRPNGTDTKSQNQKSDRHHRDIPLVQSTRKIIIAENLWIQRYYLQMGPPNETMLTT
ncbi:hypothetical protein FOMPIDRAFT_89910 [Fomitopsis schrenkii]|uniref:Uncharacterized protein n=1 Tax=Fomitopsis schrenkii TaxID=2126942 RepID=S8E3N6_FOMSC|nr:hypothetical protein FOMPIDRAFT_89910 [Fomitopsis schrenkii]